MTNPRVIVFSGPNGAGKSTAAPWLLRDASDVPHFVNADAVARGLFYDATGPTVPESSPAARRLG